MSRYYNDELYHHGIKGQHWGVRRYQNPDGSLKAAGVARYSGSSVIDAYNDEKRRRYYQNARKEQAAYKKTVKSAKQARQEREAAIKSNFKGKARKEELQRSKAEYKHEKFMAKTNRDLNKSKFEDKQFAKIHDTSMKLQKEVQERADASGNVFASKTSQLAGKGLKAYGDSVKAGQKQYNDTITNYQKARQKALSDPSIKKTKEYKAARNAYAAQRIHETLGDSENTKKYYGHEIARRNTEKKLQEYKDKYIYV